MFTSYLKDRGASFFSDIVEGTKLLRSQVEESLADLVASGLVVSDSFTGLRALLTPSHRKTQAAARKKRREAVYEMSSAGRWSIINRSDSEDASKQETTFELVARVHNGIVDPEAAEKVARIL